MMKLGIIVTDTTRKTGSVVTADPLEPSAVPAAPRCAEMVNVDRN